MLGELNPRIRVPLAPARQAERDYNWAFVELLIQGNGRNLSSAIDEANGNRFVTVISGAAYSTARSKYGGSSILFNGSSGYFSLADSLDYAFSNVDFCIEFWMYPTSAAALQFVLSQFETSIGSDTNSSFAFLFPTTRLLQFLCYASTTQYACTLVNAVPLNEWSHIACWRSGTNLRLARNGVVEATTAIATATLNDSTLTLVGGARQGATAFYAGNLQGIRITRQDSRYGVQTAFQPPLLLPTQ